MTHSEFWSLYDSNLLENASIWRKAQEDIDPEFGDFMNEVIAFTYNGKWYLRLVQFNGYHTWYCGSRSNRHIKRTGVRTWSVIKEFNTKASANAYFMKAAAGYKKV